MPTEGLRIVPGDLTDPRIIAMLEYHVAAATADMPRESCHALDVTALQQPEISFWAIWDGDRLRGVGALKDLGGGHGEVKSMHVDRATRGQGIGSAMIGHIIATAWARGYSRLSLETGGIPYFLPARALYARHGFVESEPFGSYTSDPNSVFLSLDRFTLS